MFLTITDTWLSIPNDSIFILAPLWGEIHRSIAKVAIQPENQEGTTEVINSFP